MSCHHVSVSDNPRTAMLAAIGDVTMSSGHASMALQQMAEAMTGTGLIYFILRDGTLGTQVKHVRTMVEQATTNEWIRHPPMDTEARAMVLSTLKVMEKLVNWRNRVVHDVWEPAPSENWPDGLLGYRATRWGKEHVKTTVGSLHLLGKTFFLVACVLGDAGRAIEVLRSREQDATMAHRNDPLRSARGYHRDLIARATAMESGQQEGWRWTRCSATAESHAPTRR